MPDTEVASTPETPVAPVEAPQPAPEPESDAETLLAAEREERIRLEGKVEGLSEARGPIGPTPTQQLPPVTPALIEQAYNRGEITEEQRQRAHARLEALAVLREDRRREAESTTVRHATDQLERIIDQYPDLKNGQSELIARVREEIIHQRQTTPGFNPSDPRHQLLAVRLVVGAQRGNDREFERRRLPAGGGVGSGGSMPAGPGGPRTDYLRGIPAATVSYWRSHNWIPDAESQKRYAERWRSQSERRRR